MAELTPAEQASKDAQDRVDKLNKNINDADKARQSSTGAVDGGLFNLPDLMDDLYGYSPDENDDEGRALKRGFQADMIKKFADSQIALGQAAQDQSFQLDATKQLADLELRNQTQTQADTFKYGMAEMGARYDYESRMAVDDASRELTRMAAQGDIEKMLIGAQGVQQRLNIGETGKQTRLNIGETGKQERLNIGARGVEERLGMIEAGKQTRQTQKEGLEIGGAQERLTQKEGLQIGGQETRLTQKEGLQIGGEETRQTQREGIREQSAANLAAIGKSGLVEESRIKAQSLADEYVMRATAEEQRTTQEEGLKEGGKQERLTLADQIEGQSRIQKEGLETGGEQERLTLADSIEGQSRIQKEGLQEGGSQERQTIGKTAEEGRKTIEFSDNIAARGEARSAARSRQLARR